MRRALKIREANGLVFRVCCSCRPRRIRFLLQNHDEPARKGGRMVRRLWRFHVRWCLGPSLYVETSTIDTHTANDKSSNQAVG